MAASILDACDCAGKCISPVFNTIDPKGLGTDAPGLVKHWAVTFDVQVRVLRAVLETGSATIEELILVLPGHPAPVEAIMALVDAGLLICEPGKVAPHTRISLALPSPSGGAGANTPPGAAIDASEVAQSNVVTLRSSVSHISATGFVPELFMVDVAARADLPVEIDGPIIYCALSNKKAYTGKSGSGRDRVLAPHLRMFDRVVLIRDAAGRMSVRQVGIAERILGLIIGALPGYTLSHDLPKGDWAEFAEYLELRLFVAQGLCLAKQAGFGFEDVPVLQLVVGGEGDPERAVPDNQCQTQGAIRHLYATGINALAREHEGEWIVEAGSEVRSRLTQSVGSVVNNLRHEWLFSGILVDEGDRLRLTERVSFNSGSGAANFLLGSKGPNLSAWTPPGGDSRNHSSPAI